MAEVVNIHGTDIRDAMVVSLDEVRQSVIDGEVTGLVIVAVGPRLGQPYAHTVTFGDVDHAIGQMERIKTRLILESVAR